MLDAADTSRSLIPKTFRQEEIDLAGAEERNKMTNMAGGLTEPDAVNLFNDLKQELVISYLSERYEALSEKDKIKNWPWQQAMLIADLYSNKGVAFGEEHKKLVFRVSNFARWFQTSGAPTTEYLEEFNNK